MEKAGRAAGQLVDRARDGTAGRSGRAANFTAGVTEKGTAHRQRPGVLEALERYTRPRNLEFSRLNITGLPAIPLRNLARYAGMASVKYIARMPQQIKLAVLTAFFKA